jgi:legumain
MYKHAILAALFVVLCLCSSVQAAGQNWAVLVAGSNGYYNYRHQSDICHAYQIFKKNGVPDSNIIVFMYDDIANNAQNPHKGSIINIDNGPNVYPGVPKDYIGDTVTPSNFLNVLLGKDMTGIGSGKTLKSGPNDRVFIFFSDHGAPGLVAFPGFKMLYAKDLIPVLTSMSNNKRFDQLVFYLEACESGSMFNKILSDKLRIYATTASNPFESSYACDYNSNYNAYLNDCYSFNYMNDTDFADVSKRSLQDQFVTIKQVTTQSHVCQYGDLSIASQPIGNYLANSFKIAKPTNKNGARTVVPKRGVNSRDVKEVYLLKNIERADAFEKPIWMAEYKQYKKEQDRIDTIFGALSSSFNLHRVRDAREAASANAADHCNSQSAIDMDCIKDSTIAFENECGSFNEYSIRYVSYIRDACDAKVGINALQRQLRKICSAVTKA